MDAIKHESGGVTVEVHLDGVAIEAGHRPLEMVKNPVSTLNPAIEPTNDKQYDKDNKPKKDN